MVRGSDCEGAGSKSGPTGLTASSAHKTTARGNVTVMLS